MSGIYIVIFRLLELALVKITVDIVFFFINKYKEKKLLKRMEKRRLNK
jgi:hypothetical protein